MIRVLLVDDQALLRTGLRIVIDSEADLNVVGEAADGQEAIRLLADLEVEVILMDIRMPGIDGITATALITAAHPRVKIIILTTYDIDQYVFDGLRSGASGFLLKDATPESLTDAIRTVAGGESVLAPTATTRLVSRFAASPDEQQGGRPAKTEVIDSLTDREREVFQLMARGLSNRELAAELYVSEHTVKIHVARVLAKLDLRDRVQAVVLAYESGLVTPDSH
ncbi:two component transcriptional regulator, LuxR family [Frankineae bacterium MT45]|nr:two component transcriptional regulator, LuxR family [Frankineae bacterium MT45]